MRKILTGEKCELFWEKPRKMDKKIHKSGKLLKEIISSKRILNTQLRDQ